MRNLDKYAIVVKSPTEVRVIAYLGSDTGEPITSPIIVKKCGRIIRIIEP